MTTKTTTQSVTQDFEQLVSSYRRLLAACADALAPGKPQSERNEVRDAIEGFLAAEKD